MGCCRWCTMGAAGAERQQCARRRDFPRFRPAGPQRSATGQACGPGNAKQWWPPQRSAAHLLRCARRRRRRQDDAGARCSMCTPCQQGPASQCCTLTAKLQAERASACRAGREAAATATSIAAPSTAAHQMAAGACLRTMVGLQQRGAPRPVSCVWRGRQRGSRRGPKKALPAPPDSLNHPSRCHPGPSACAHKFPRNCCGDCALRVRPGAAQGPDTAAARRLALT